MAKIVRHRNDLSGLLVWLPMRWLGWLALLVLAIPASRMLLDMGHFVPGGLAIETQGESGEIGDGWVSLDLPLHVYNGTDRVIFRVSLWVEAFACPEDDAILSSCKKIIAFEQDVPMRTSPKSSGSFRQNYSGGVPDALPGRHLRILRKVEGVVDEADHERERQALADPD